MSASTKRIVLYGSGDTALVAHAVLTHDSSYEIAAFTVDGAQITAPTLLGLPVVPFEEVDRHYPPETFAMHIAVGFRRVNALRAEKYCHAKAKGYRLPSYVSTRAITWPDLTIGDNCWIMDGSIIQPFATIGNDVYMGPGCHVGHHAVVGDHCFLAGMSSLAGAVRLGTHCFLGMNTAVRNAITVANHCVIGAGATILRNTRERGVYMAPPATLLPTSSDALPDDFGGGAIR